MSYLPNNNRTMFIQTINQNVSNTVAESSILNSGLGSLLIPANSLEPGDTIRFSLLGYHSAVANPNITVKVKFGSTVMLTTGVVASGNATNQLVQLAGLITIRAVGAVGTITGHGYWQELGGGINNFQMINLGVVNLDTTVNQTVDITVQWGTASGSNTVTSTNVLIEKIKP